MKITTILEFIDLGHMALPEFQRGYVWNRDQVRGLFDSLYRRHPVGGLLVWATESGSAIHRGDGPLATGVVKLLLDGQQRVTSIYGVVRGHPPRFFDGNELTFTGLWFHLETEVFQFYTPLMMQGDPLWIDVTALMRGGHTKLGEFITELNQKPELVSKLSTYVGRLNKLLGIGDVDLHIEEITGADKTVDVVVDIFNRVNSGGTKLSKGDLALAKICSDWPEARGEMKATLSHWTEQDYHFNLDWLLRSVNTAITGEARFLYLHEIGADRVQDGLKRATKAIDACLNLISGRLGLDHDRVLFGRYAIPVMVRYLDQRGASLEQKERDKLLFWFVQAGMWGRFSGSTESSINQDLAALEGDGNTLDRLLEQLRLWHGSLRTEAAHFTGWSLGARFYPVLYMLTRVGEARDWCSGLPLKSNLLGKFSSLEVHHIFPKAQLYNKGYKRPQVNAIGNYCFLTKDCNLQISDKRPEDYFPEVEQHHPGALASQWIPDDPNLWKLENYLEFLAARRELLAAETNRLMEELLHGEDRWLAGTPRPPQLAATVLGGITSEEEDDTLAALNEWVEARALPRGMMAYDYTNLDTGEQLAVLDLAWPDGLQEELSQPVAVLLDEEPATLAMMSATNFRCFTSPEEFKGYVVREILPAEVSVG